MSDYRQCPHGFHHPPHIHSCDGCWCEGERDRRDYGWPHDTAPERTWPDAHVVLQDVINPALDYSIPFGVHVFVFDTVEHLREACGDPEASAHSTTYEQPDSAGIGAIVMLAEPELSLVAHEATHIALHHHGNEVGRGGAKTWLAHHPESVAEMIGNLTALIWYRVAS